MNYRTQAEFFIQGITKGFVEASEVIAWCDEIIVTAPKTEDWMIDISTCGPGDRMIVLSHLNTIKGEVDAAELLEIEQDTDADQKESQPNRLPTPVDVNAEKAGHAAAEREKRKKIGGETEDRIKYPRKTGTDDANKIGGIRVGRIRIEAEVRRIVRDKRKQRDYVKREPEAADDLLEEGELGQIFDPGFALRNGTTRHGED